MARVAESEAMLVSKLLEVDLNLRASLAASAQALIQLMEEERKPIVFWPGKGDSGNAAEQQQQQSKLAAELSSHRKESSPPRKHPDKDNPQFSTESLHSLTGAEHGLDKPQVMTVGRTRT